MNLKWIRSEQKWIRSRKLEFLPTPISPSVWEYIFFIPKTFEDNEENVRWRCMHFGEM